MKNQKAISHSLQLLIQLQKLSANNNSSGYALLMASLISVLLFSMLSVYIFSSNLYKASADTIVDSSSTFYASELALNRRANAVRGRFDDFSQPSGSAPSGANIAEQMTNCINSTAGAVGTGDFACNVAETIYREASTKGGSAADGSFTSSSSFDTKANVRYRSFSFVRDISSTSAQLETIESGNFQGLRAQNYRYRVYSTAIKQGGSDTNNISAQSMLQMEFINRLIPVFQFAAFYEDDLEITSSSAMTLTGPVHTNGNLYLVPGGFLTLRNRSTFVNDVYKSLPYNPFHSGTSDGRRVLMAGGGPYSASSNVPCISLNCLNVSNGNGVSSVIWLPANTRVSAPDIVASNGMLQRQSRLSLPQTGFLNRSGEYFEKADLRVDFNPGRTGTGTPFNVTSINRSAGTPGVDFSTIPGLLNSLRKPVLLRVDSFATDKQSSAVSRLCPQLNGSDGNNITIGGEPNLTAAMPSLVSSLPTLQAVLTSIDSKRKVIAALQEAIAQTPTVTYQEMKSPATNASATNRLRDNFNTALQAVRPDLLPAFTNAATRNSILALPLNVIASLDTTKTDTAAVPNPGNGGCFLPAPMQVLAGVNDRKEDYTSGGSGRSMTILQSHIKSLTAWNRDGSYWDGTRVQSTADMLFVSKRAARLATTPGAAEPAVPTATNSKAIGQCDFDCLEMSSVDNTEGGLVWHYSMIDRNSPYNYVSNDTLARDNSKGKSPYGFAFSGGRRLPGALTIASDQAIYLQGDYNNPSNRPGDQGIDLDQTRFQLPSATVYPPAIEKKPASFLGDSMTILSNACYDPNNYRLNCLTPSMAPADLTLSSDRVRFTVVRAAILSGTEKTKVNGTTLQEIGAGLNNHIRMLENWQTGSTINSDKTFKYRGSFVSKGIPTEFNGEFRPGGTYFNIPNRDFGFDNDFDRVDGLPPLTPRVNLLNQKVFRRDYDSQNRN
jgi:hypothetical protein